MFAVDVNCICFEKGIKEKNYFATPSVTSVESS